MKPSEAVSEEPGTDAQPQTAALVKPKLFSLQLFSLNFSLKRLRGGAVFVLGYLLSPLCWWNDLIFNLPVAYGFGYLCSLISPSWLLPGLIVGYWLSNLVGFVLMQFGAVDALQNQDKPRNLKKELLMGVVSSTVYTLVILVLVQLKILDISALLPDSLLSNGLNLGVLLPGSLQ
jgi:hypothetical protein